jgi:hypothetical protein
LDDSLSPFAESASGLGTTPAGKAEASFGGEKASASRRPPKHSQEWLCHKEDAGLKAGLYKGRKGRREILRFAQNDNV